MKLKNINLGSFLRTNRHSSQLRVLGGQYDVIYEDLNALWQYNSYYKSFFEDTIVTGIVDPFKHGLSGETVLVSPIITDGILFNTGSGRPKTVYEAIGELYTVIGTELDTDTGIEIANVKNAVGMNLFNTAMPSAAGSVDIQLQEVQAQLRQISADCFNVGHDVGDVLDTTQYDLDTVDQQTIDDSLRDQINTLFELHGSKAAPAHYGVGTKMILSSIGGVFVGDDVKYIAPFSELAEDIEGGRFYSPVPNELSISNLTCRAQENTISGGNTYIDVMLNGISQISVTIPPESTDVIINTEDSFIMNQGDYLQFRISTSAGTIFKLSSISVTAEETIQP